MAKKEINIFADLQAKRENEEAKKRYTHIEPNGSYSPTGVKLKSTGDAIRWLKNLYESGDAPIDSLAASNLQYSTMCEEGMSTGKVSCILTNKNRRIMNAYCQYAGIGPDKWAIMQTLRGLNKLTTKQYLEVLQLAIDLPSELCSDTPTERDNSFLRPPYPEGYEKTYKWKS